MPNKTIHMNDVQTGTDVPMLILDNGDGSYAQPYGVNIEGALLTSAVRSASVNTPDQINYNAAGVLVYCNITAVPGTDTVQFIVQSKDPVSGVYINLATDVAQAATGMRTLLIYPGAGAASGDINVVRNGPLPRIWRVRVVHSAGSSFTYSVGYALIL